MWGGEEGGGGRADGYSGDFVMWGRGGLGLLLASIEYNISSKYSTSYAAPSFLWPV